MDNDILIIKNFLIFKPIKLAQYLSERQSQGRFGSTKDHEVVVALHLRKIYEEMFAKDGYELRIGFELNNKENEIDILPEKFETVEYVIERIVEERTYSDVIYFGFKEKEIKRNVCFQIKHFGLGNTQGTGTYGLIKLLEKVKSDSPTGESLIINILLEKSGEIDRMKLQNWIKDNEIKYKQLITLHYSKKDDRYVFFQLKPNSDSDDGKVGYKSFSVHELVDFKQHLN